LQLSFGVVGYVCISRLIRWKMEVKSVSLRSRYSFRGKWKKTATTNGKELNWQKQLSGN